jgi:hypothetical protein
VWKPIPRSAATAASSSTGSTTPWGKLGAEPTMATVWRVTARRMAATSARRSGPTGTRTSLMPKYWAALSKATWAVVGATTWGRADRRPARLPARSR